MAEPGTSIKEKVLSFHKAVDHFFEERKREAEPIRAAILLAAVLVLTAILFGNWFMHPAYSASFILVSLIVEWFVGKKFGGRCDVFQFVYVALLPALFFFGLLFVASPVKAWWGASILGYAFDLILLLLLSIFLPYISIVSLKVAFGFSTYLKTVKFLVVAYVFSIGALMIFFALLGIVLTPIVTYKGEIKENESVISYYYKDMLCTVKFPKVREIMIGDWGYKGLGTFEDWIIDPSDSYFTDVYGEGWRFIFISHVPTNISLEEINTEYEKALKRKEDKTSNIANVSLIKLKDGVILDIKKVKEEDGEVETLHEISGAFEENVGFRYAMYRSYSTDDHFYYIINNIHCSRTS